MEQPNRCLIENLKTNRRHIVYKSSILTKNNSGMFEEASKHHIKSGAQLYTKLDGKITAVDMIYYGATKQDLMVIRKSKGDKRIRIHKKLSYTPIPSKRMDEKKKNMNDLAKFKKQRKAENKANVASHQNSDEDIISLISIKKENKDENLNFDGDLSPRKSLQSATISEVSHDFEGSGWNSINEEVQKPDVAESANVRKGSASNANIEGAQTLDRESLRIELAEFKKSTINELKVIPQTSSFSPINDGKIEINGIRLDASDILKAGTVRKMRMRANHIMRAYWTGAQRDRLATRRNRRRPFMTIVDSKEYEDLIQLCLALQKSKKLKCQSFKNDPRVNMRKWVQNFLKNDRASRKKSSRNNDEKEKRSFRAKSI